MEINKGELLWSKNLKKTNLKEILNFIMKTEIPGLLSVSDKSFLIINEKKVIAASCKEKTGDNALVDLFESFKNEDEVFFYSMGDIDSLKKKNPEIFLKNPEKALTNYLKSNPDLSKDLAKKIGTKISREEIMARYKIKEPSDEEVNRTLSPFELKKKKAELKDFKEFIDVIYGRV